MWMAQTSQSNNTVDGSTVVFLSQMLKHNVTIICNDNIWNCDGGPTDITFVYVGDNQFITTDVSTSMLKIPFQVKCLLFCFRCLKLYTFWSNCFIFINNSYLVWFPLCCKNWIRCEVGMLPK